MVLKDFATHFPIWDNEDFPLHKCVVTKHKIRHKNTSNYKVKSDNACCAQLSYLTKNLMFFGIP